MSDIVGAQVKAFIKYSTLKSKIRFWSVPGPLVIFAWANLDTVNVPCTKTTA